MLHDNALYKFNIDIDIEKPFRSEPNYPTGNVGTCLGTSRAKKPKGDM